MTTNTKAAHEAAVKIIRSLPSWAALPLDEDVCGQACIYVAAMADAALLLESALREAMDAVQFFHGEDAWEIYRDCSPEMQRWREALAAIEQARKGE